MLDNTSKLPISVLVASYNEGHLLEDCLKSLAFCDEIYFVNLGSTDNSVEIAKKYATKIEEFKRVPRIEDVHPIYIPKLKHDWFILIDPDERIKPALGKDIGEYIKNPQPFASLVRVPILYLFKGKMLKGGPYQKVIRGRLLFYRPGINITDEVHIGITAKVGYGIGQIPFTGENYDEHFWCNSWQQIKYKHNRYSQGEGKVLYNKGKRFSLIATIAQTIKSFYHSLVKQRYYKDKIIGLRFAYYQSRYTFLSWLSLKKYQKSLKVIGTYKPPSLVQLDLAIEKVKVFKKTSKELTNQYQAAAEKLKPCILAQYQKSVKRLVNDLLEINAFDLANKVIESAGFNEEMKNYLAQDLLLGRLKLIQESGSYRFYMKIKRVIKKCF